MKISDLPRPGAVHRPGDAARHRAGAGFTVATDPARAAGGPAPGAPLAALHSVLALQEVRDLPERRRRAVGRAHAVLDELEDLRLAMVEDVLPEAALRRLAALVDAGELAAGEPALDGVLREIEVRAAVELAKRAAEDDPGAPA